MSRRRKSGHQARANRHAGGAPVVEPGDEDDLERIVSQAKTPFVLVLDGVQDPHNLGACLRTADGAGVDAVVAPRHRAVAITETVVRIACGAAESVPFIQVTNVAQTLRALKEAGLWVIGTADDTETQIWDADLKGPLALVLGAEGEGVRRLTRELCDVVVQIPMRGAVECLNVSVATGVALFEAVRQRRKS